MRISGGEPPFPTCEFSITDPSPGHTRSARIRSLALTSELSGGLGSSGLSWSWTKSFSRSQSSRASHGCRPASDRIPVGEDLFKGGIHGIAIQRVSYWSRSRPQKAAADESESSVEHGQYLVLLRIEATDDKEGDANLAAVGVGPGVVHSGAVAGFPIPPLRYFAGGGPDAQLTSELALLWPVENDIRELGVLVVNSRHPTHFILSCSGAALIQLDQSWPSQQPVHNSQFDTT